MSIKRVANIFFTIFTLAKGDEGEAIDIQVSLSLHMLGARRLESFKIFTQVLIKSN